MGSGSLPYKLQGEFPLRVVIPELGILDAPDTLHLQKLSEKNRLGMAEQQALKETKRTNTLRKCPLVLSST